MLGRGKVSIPLTGKIVKVPDSVQASIPIQRFLNWKTGQASISMTEPTLFRILTILSRMKKRRSLRIKNTRWF